MKAIVEIELPEGFVSDSDNSSEILLQRLQDLFDTADQPIELKSIREINHDPVWQLWEEKSNGDWVVFDTVSTTEFPASRIRDKDDYQSLKSRVCRTVDDAEFMAAKRIVEKGKTPVIRHEKDISQNPVSINVYSPDYGEILLDISAFLMDAKESDLEWMAGCRWEMAYMHVGVALESLKERSHPAFRTALKGKKLNETMDGNTTIFMHELFHDRDEFEAYLLETKGHDLAVFVDSEKLEAWLRQNRSDVNYPDTTPTP